MKNPLLLPRRYEEQPKRKPKYSRTDGVAASVATGAPTPRGAVTPVASCPFAIPVSALDSTGTSQASRGLRKLPAPDSLSSEGFPGSRNPVTAWQSVRTTGGDLQVANVHSRLSFDMTVPRSGGLGSLPALAMLDSEADVSSILEAAVIQLKACFSGGQLWVPLEQGSRTVRLAHDEVETLIQKTAALQLTVHTP